MIGNVVDMRQRSFSNSNISNSLFHEKKTVKEFSFENILCCCLTVKFYIKPSLKKL